MKVISDQTKSAATLSIVRSFELADIAKSMPSAVATALVGVNRAQAANQSPASPKPPSPPTPSVQAAPTAMMGNRPLATDPIQELKAFAQRTETAIASQRSDIERISAVVSGIQRDMHDFRTFMAETRSEMSLRARYADLHHFRGEMLHELGLMRNATLNGTQNAAPNDETVQFTVEEVDAITESISRINQKTSEIDTLKTELQFMKSRLRRLEDHSRVSVQPSMNATPEPERHRGPSGDSGIDFASRKRGYDQFEVQYAPSILSNGKTSPRISHPTDHPNVVRQPFTVPDELGRQRATAEGYWPPRQVLADSQERQRFEAVAPAERRTIGEGTKERSGDENRPPEGGTQISALMMPPYVVPNREYASTVPPPASNHHRLSYSHTAPPTGQHQEQVSANGTHAALKQPISPVNDIGGPPIKRPRGRPRKDGSVPGTPRSGQPVDRVVNLVERSRTPESVTRLPSNPHPPTEYPTQQPRPDIIAPYGIPRPAWLQNSNIQSAPPPPQDSTPHNYHITTPNSVPNLSGKIKKPAVYDENGVRLTKHGKPDGRRNNGKALEEWRTKHRAEKEVGNISPQSQSQIAAGEGDSALKMTENVVPSIEAPPDDQPETLDVGTVKRID
jgi:hypothetical protein